MYLYLSSGLPLDINELKGARKKRSGLKEK